jgi:uncharacterized protein YjbI with pentapeptide repeats
MANQEQLDVLRQGPKVWNRWRKENPDHILDFGGADLSGEILSNAILSNANLSGTSLGHARLSGADLSGANLSRAYCSGADFSRANLRGARLLTADFRVAKLLTADLRNADLSGSNLSGVNLSNMDLSGVSLTGTNLMRACLRGVNLHRAKFNETVFGDTDLNGVIGLVTCKHQGPSTIDFRTIAKSGRLPLEFLRGCGLPDTLIEYLPSLLNEPIQFYSCFISYSTKDQEFADRLHADLQNKGVRCWFAPHDMQAGKRIHEQIDEAIRVYERLLLILSPASMESEWVEMEIAKARKRELQEERRMLFPVRLVDFETLRDWECFDADVGKDSAREIREFYIPDFSNWKDHDCYQKEFEKLLRDLKPERKAL